MVVEAGATATATATTTTPYYNYNTTWRELPSPFTVLLLLN
jgi:hypothetical protein